MAAAYYEKVAVIGAGTMGNGIAQVFAQGASEVLLIDTVEAALDKGVGAIEKNLGRMVKKEKLSQEDADAALARIHKSTRLEDISDQALVVEAIVERADVKAQVFSTLDKLAAQIGRAHV